MADEHIALCHLEYDGVEYNFGDVVPKTVADAHPTGVGLRGLTHDDIDKMGKAELAERLKELSVGQVEPLSTGGE